MRGFLHLVERRPRLAALAAAALGSASIVVALASPGAGNAQSGPLLPLNDLQPVLGLLIGGQMPAQAPVQTPTEPTLLPSPPATCGPGSHPLSGEQGRVPAAALFSPAGAHGYTCNLSVLSHQGSSGGYKVWRYVDHQGHVCAFYDTALVYPINAISLAGPASTGVAVLNMADPAHPVQTDTLTSLPMLSPHESLNLNYTRGLLAADLGNPTTYPGLMSIYDVSHDCLHPTLDSTYLAARFGHESGFSPDGNTFWIAGAFEGLAAVDVSDPRHPRTIWQGNEWVHGLSLSDDGNTAYAADPVNGELTTLNVSQIQHRLPNPKVSEISRLTWATASIPQNSDPIQIDGHPYLLEFDEFAFRFNAGVGNVGAARMIDIADPSHPKVVSNLRLAVNQAAAHLAATLDPQPLNLPNLGYSAHYCAVPREVNPEIVACSFTNSGLRIFNIQDPRHPREVGYYVSPAKRALVNGLSGSDFALSKPAFDPATREVWYTDAASGFYAVRLDSGIWPDPTGRAGPAPRPAKRRCAVPACRRALRWRLKWPG
jgi:hypothetical protein